MLKQKIFAVITAVFISLGLNAQTLSPAAQNSSQISDAELQKFAKVSADLNKLQQSSRADMEQIVRDNGMEVQRFSEISRAKQSGQSIDMTEAEKTAYTNITGKLQKYQQQNQQKALAILDKHSLGQQKFMMIRKQLSQDEALQKRYKKIQQ